MKSVQEYLIQLGLTDSQAGALSVLLEGHELTAKKISAGAGIPYTKVYDVLKALEARGLVIARLTKPKAYKALPAESVFENLIAAQESGLSQIKKTKTDILEQIGTGYALQEPKLIDSQIWLYQGTDAIYEAVSGIVDDSTRSVRFVGRKESFILFFSHVKTMEAVYRALQRGVEVYMLYPPNLTAKDILSLASKVASKHWYKVLYILKSKKTHIKVADQELEVNYMLRDDEEFGTAYPDEQGHVKYGLRFQDKSITKFMTNYYEMLWGRGRSVTGKLSGKG